MSKHLLYIALIATTLLASGIFFKSDLKNIEETVESDISSIVNRDFSKISQKLQGSNSQTTYLKYKTNVDIEIQRKQVDGQESEQEDTQVSGECVVASTFDSNTNVFDLSIAYTKIDQHSVQPQEVQENQSKETISYKHTEFYTARVSALSGEILELNVPKKNQPSESIKWSTEELIYAILPDLRKETFDNTPIDVDTIGEYQAIIDYQQHDDDHIMVTKKYTNDHYVSLHQKDYNPPQVNFNKHVIVAKDSGLVKSGKSTQNYKIGDDTKQSEEDGVKIDNIVGALQVNINTEWEFVSVFSDADFIKDMEDFEENNQFQKVKLSKFKETKVVHGVQEEKEDQDEIQKLSSSRQLADKSFNLVNFSILSQNVVMSLEILTYTDHVVVEGNIIVNGSNKITVVQKSAQNCIEYDNPYSGNKQITLFEVVYPVGGLITLPVTASAGIDYGLDTNITGSDSQCVMSIKPHFDAYLIGTGEASLAGTISAGVYAKGTFLNTNLVFSSTIQKSNFATELSLTGSMIAAQFEFGGVYKLFTCDKAKLLSFQWASACQIGEDIYKPFVQKQTQGLNKTFWQQELFGGV